ncbi:MAG: tRNA pseudouridine(55) synthase TruB [Deltaproteobacteria bacterium]|nr:tRNA pseudouridine(55) synthase TruB [Deltaproteobacteria bacterium]
MLCPSGVVIINKPAGSTSHAVTQGVKRLLSAKKTGHTGTLDPFATGVLPICVNEATKLVQFLALDDKCYQATVRFGSETDTGDVEGDVVAAAEWEEVTPERLRRELSHYCGEIELEIPLHSAVKVGGRPLYFYAHRGIEVKELPRRKSLIYQIDLIDFSLPHATLEIHCAKGTYIRSLVKALGRSLGSLAHLVHLDRLQSGIFSKSSALTLETLEEKVRDNPAALEEVMIRPADALPMFPSLFLAPHEVRRVRNGIPLHRPPVQCASFRDQSCVRLLDEKSGGLVAVGKVKNEGIIDLVRVFFGAS